MLVCTCLALLLALPTRRSVLLGSTNVIAVANIDSITRPPLCVSVAVHDDCDRWLTSSYRPRDEMEAVIRCIVGRDTDDGSATVVSFCPSSATASMRQFYSTNPPQHVHFFEAALLRTAAGEGRYATVEPTAENLDALGLRRGGGFMVGGHGLTVGFGLWQSQFTSESSDSEHARLGVSGSAAGPLLPGSTDAPLPGLMVLHATAGASDALALAAQLSEGLGGDPRVKEALNLGIMRRPLYATAAEIVRVDSSYGGAPSRPSTAFAAKASAARGGRIACCCASSATVRDGGVTRRSLAALAATPLLARAGTGAASAADNGAAAPSATTPSAASSGSDSESVPPPRVVFVAGATGRTGRRLIEVLRATAGVDVVAGVRSEASAASKLPAGVPTVVADVSSDTAVADLSHALLSRGVTDVVCAIGFAPTCVDQPSAALRSPPQPSTALRGLPQLRLAPHTMPRSCSNRRPMPS